MGTTTLQNKLVGVKNMGKRESALLWLAGLTDKAFAEFFYEAVRGRKTCDDFGHFVLADGIVMDGKWFVDLIAVHDPEEYQGPWADDSPICQESECDVCGSRTRSWAKHALCPVCGTKVYGT